MVNPRKILTLTDFEESTFEGENAKNSGICAKMPFSARRVYHANINDAAALRKCVSLLSPRGSKRAPLSGLARAFIYAQARALLVSHWEVASDATVKLIAGAMRRLAADKAICRAEAMRQSMLALIDHG